MPAPFAKRMAHRGAHSSSPGLATGIQQPTRGCPSRWLAPSRRETLSFESACSTSRASSPLLFGLAPRGVFRAPDVAIGAVGSYPTFSPLPTMRAFRRRLAGFPARCHRARSAGGLFSVALSVTPCSSDSRRRSTSPPGVTRRVALSRSASQQNAVLRHRPSRAYDDGVRTFLPSSVISGLSKRPAHDRDQRSPGSPAILIIARHHQGLGKYPRRSPHFTFESASLSELPGNRPALQTNKPFRSFIQSTTNRPALPGSITLCYDLRS